MGTMSEYRGNNKGLSDFLRYENRFYVYILRRPDGQEFYVGKGKKDRVFYHVREAQHETRYSSNPYKTNIIRSILKSGAQIIYEIDSLFEDEVLAYKRETQLIEKLKRLHEGGLLTNLAPGGGSTAGAAPHSKEKHRASLGGVPTDDSERAILNRFLLSLGQPKSICVKVVGRVTRPKPTQAFKHVTRKPTKRQALAIVASAIANGIELSSGCEVPRRFTHKGVDAFVENGVSRDIVTSGLAKVLPAEDPLYETFIIDTEGLADIIRLIGEKQLRSYGLI